MTVFLLGVRLFSINLENVTVSPMPILYLMGKLFFGYSDFKASFSEIGCVSPRPFFKTIRV